MQAEDLMADIITKVGVMLAADIDIDTIRFFIITNVSSLNLTGMEKVMFIGSLEEALEKKCGLSINLK